MQKYSKGGSQNNGEAQNGPGTGTNKTPGWCKLTGQNLNVTRWQL